MVRVLANGDIVADNDPRARGSGSGPSNAPRNGRQVRIYLLMTSILCIQFSV